MARLEIFNLLSANVFYLEKSNILLFGKELTLNPFPNKPRLIHVYSRSRFKTLWAREKWLVTSHFSFSHGIFYRFGELSAILSNLKFSFLNSLSLEESFICFLLKGLTTYLMYWYVLL